MDKKITTLSRLLKALSKQRPRKKVVFTNGCFDILHYGHIKYLKKAKSCGDTLVVGLNSDASVRRLKGNKRPINTERDRAEVLAALESVDHIIIFNEGTPYKLIGSLKPDILVKGGDWRKEKIVGADIVLANGGKVISLPYVKNKSTTNTIKKILHAC
ncbi:MAG: D-glycero-beta-D-manno-heptose 1-phosphate adenylyltransferase [Candidatus Omnitrophota bacterium]